MNLSPQRQAELFLQSLDLEEAEPPAGPLAADLSDNEAETRWYDSARALDVEGEGRQAALGFELESPSAELDGWSVTSEQAPRPLEARPKSSGSLARTGWGTAEHDQAVRQQAVVDLFKRRRLDLPSFPWEQQQWGASSLLRSRLNAVPTVGMVAAEVVDASSVPWTVTRRLQRTRVVRSEDEIRDAALQRLKVLILLDPEATALGRSLLKMGMELEGEEKIGQSIADAFRAKASTTLQKRAFSLQAYVMRLWDLGFDSPWRLTETQMYSVFCKLRDDGSKPSTAQHVIEALNVFNGICKFIFMSLDDVVASRTRGVARDLALKKGPISQRDPLTLAQVRALETLMVQGDRR